MNSRHEAAGSAPGPLRSTSEAWFPVAIAFASSRLLIFGLILLSRTVIVRGSFWHPGGLLAQLTQWDGGWYLSIVRDGYQLSTEHQSNMGFFPFYPLLVKLVSYIVSDIDSAGVLTANVCLFFAGIILYTLVRQNGESGRVARRTVIFLMFSPVSFFFSSAYTESTFLMLALGAFLAARQRRWFVASLCGMAASATRQVGLLITFPLFIEYLHQAGEQRAGIRPFLSAKVLLLALIPMGFGWFALYSYLRFHDPLAFFHATAVWGRQLTSPLNTFSNARNYAVFYRWLFLGTLLSAIVLWLTAFVFKLRASYQAYVAIYVLVYISSNSLEAIPRNLSVLFPLFITVALITDRHEWLYEGFLASSIGLLTICTILFANGFWMT